jgi:hypothetical protein
MKTLENAFDTIGEVAAVTAGLLPVAFIAYCTIKILFFQGA